MCSCGTSSPNNDSVIAETKTDPPEGAQSRVDGLEMCKEVRGLHGFITNKLNLALAEKEN